MKDTTALKLIAAIEIAIRELEIEKSAGWDQDVDDLTDTIKHVMDMSDSVRKCECCDEYKTVKKLERECVSCLDGASEWEGVLPDGSSDTNYRAPDRDDY